MPETVLTSAERARAMSECLLGMEIPEPFEFLNWAWWLIHLVGIAAAVYVGYLLAKKCCGGAAGATPKPPQQPQ